MAWEKKGYHYSNIYITVVYLSIRRVVKQIVVIIEACHFCQ